MTRTFLLVAVSWTLLATQVARAQDEASVDAVRAALARMLPSAKPESISASPIAGLFEVIVGPNVLYVSADGRYLLNGADLYDLENRANLTEERRKVTRLKAIEALGEASMIVFTPPETKHTVTVFTDVDCPYCSRLHNQMAGYNALGIEVRYAAFPRAGIPSNSYDKTVSVWCADDPHEAIGVAKAGRAVDPRQCPNPVADHYRAGREIGISGTPAIVLSDGTVVPGYVEPARLARMIEEQG